jgi:hypothetical protein
MERLERFVCQCDSPTGIPLRAEAQVFAVFPKAALIPHYQWISTRKNSTLSRQKLESSLSRPSISRVLCGRVDRGEGPTNERKHLRLPATRFVDTILTDTASFGCAKMRFGSHLLLGKSLVPRRLWGFQDRCIKPLCHPSGSSNANNATAVGIGKSYSKIGKTRTKSIGALNLPKRIPICWRGFWENRQFFGESFP